MTAKEWISITIGLVLTAGTLTAYVHTSFASEAEVGETKESIKEIAGQVTAVATQQAVAQDQIGQLLEAAKLSRDEAKEYREALIRLEERTRQQ